MDIQKELEYIKLKLLKLKRENLSNNFQFLLMWFLLVVFCVIVTYFFNF